MGGEKLPLLYHIYLVRLEDITERVHCVVQELGRVSADRSAKRPFKTFPSPVTPRVAGWLALACTPLAIEHLSTLLDHSGRNRIRWKEKGVACCIVYFRIWTHILLSLRFILGSRMWVGGPCAFILSSLRTITKIVLCCRIRIHILCRPIVWVRGPSKQGVRGCRSLPPIPCIGFSPMGGKRSRRRKLVVPRLICGS
jgi:hypothetical protein